MPESAAYVIIDSEPRLREGRAPLPARQIFRGWMYASTPGVNPVQHPVYDAWLVACKAAELHWAAFSCILKSRAVQPSAQELEQARVDFLKLSVATARRMFRFWLVRGTAKTEVGAA